MALRTRNSCTFWIQLFLPFLNTTRIINSLQISLLASYTLHMLNVYTIHFSVCCTRYISVRLQGIAKEALLNVSVCRCNLQSRNVLTSPTSQPELSQLPRHTQNTILLTDTHTHWFQNQNWKQNKTRAAFTFLLPVVRWMFSCSYGFTCILYSVFTGLQCAGLMSLSLSLSKSSEVLSSTHSSCSVAINHNARL